MSFPFMKPTFDIHHTFEVVVTLICEILAAILIGLSDFYALFLIHKLEQSNQLFEASK